MEVLKIAQFLVASLLCLGLGYVFVLASAYLKEKIRQARESPTVSGNEVLDGAFECASGIISKIAAATVGKLEQVAGKELRELVKDGKVGKAELYALAEKAYKEVVELVSPDIINGLKQYTGDAGLYIRNIIETELLKLKSGMK